MQKKLTGFTLVELIVVVSILTILSTIWFVAYSWYLWWVRDVNRVWQLQWVADAVKLYNTRYALPIPEDYVEIKSTDTIIWYQWVIWEKTLNLIDYQWEWIDPKYDEYFTYRTNKNSNNFAVMTYLEEQKIKTFSSIHQKTFANNYNKRNPFIVGDKVWVIINDQNTPINKIWDITDTGYFDIQNVWSIDYTVIFSNDYTFSANTNGLLPILPNYDCKRIKDLNPQKRSWIAGIDPDGDNQTDQVYCKMDYDGWGWTLSTMLATRRTSTSSEEAANLFDTQDNNFITSVDEDIRDKWNLDNVWIDSYNRDILFQCVSEFEEFKWYESPFIIYNFEAVDKSNLTKLNKQETQFSSKNLQATWKSHNYSLSTTYGSSSKDNAMYFVRQEDQDARLFILHARIWAGNNAGTSYVYDEKSPAYSQFISTGTTEFKLISPTNYCYSATRLNLSDFNQ